MVGCLLVGVAQSNKSTDLLHDAIRRGSLKDVKTALGNEADLNHRGPGGQTPLMQATLQGHAEIVEHLLTLAPDWSIGEEQGYTPMHGAGFQGRAEVMKILLRHGLDPNDRHRDGFTPLHRACWGAEARHTDTVRVLVEEGHVDPNQLTSDGKTPMAITRNTATKQLLKSYGGKATSPRPEL